MESTWKERGKKKKGMERTRDAGKRYRRDNLTAHLRLSVLQSRRCSLSALFSPQPPNVSRVSSKAPNILQKSPVFCPFGGVRSVSRSLSSFPSSRKLSLLPYSTGLTGLSVAVRGRTNANSPHPTLQSSIPPTRTTQPTPSSPRGSQICGVLFSLQWIIRGPFRGTRCESKGPRTVPIVSASATTPLPPTANHITIAPRLTPRTTSRVSNFLWSLRPRKRGRKRRS